MGAANLLYRYFQHFFQVYVNGLGVASGSLCVIFQYQGSIHCFDLSVAVSITEIQLGSCGIPASRRKLGVKLQQLGSVGSKYLSVTVNIAYLIGSKRRICGGGSRNSSGCGWCNGSSSCNAWCCGGNRSAVVFVTGAAFGYLCVISVKTVG